MHLNIFTLSLRSKTFKVCDQWSGSEAISVYSANEVRGGVPRGDSSQLSIIPVSHVNQITTNYGLIYYVNTYIYRFTQNILKQTFFKGNYYKLLISQLYWLENHYKITGHTILHIIQQQVFSSTCSMHDILEWFDRKLLINYFELWIIFDGSNLGGTVQRKEYGRVYRIHAKPCIQRHRVWPPQISERAIFKIGNFGKLTKMTSTNRFKQLKLTLKSV